MPLVIALFLGLSSFIISMMISKYAPVMTLAIAGILSLVVIVISLAILWTRPPPVEELEEAEEIPEPPLPTVLPPAEARLPIGHSESSTYVGEPEQEEIIHQ